MARTFKITKGYGDSVATFELRMISIREEIEFSSQFAEFGKLSPDEKEKATHAAYVKAIGDWSVAPPKNKDGEPVNDEKLFTEAVQKYFESMDPIEAERIANAVIYQFQRDLQPDVVF